MDLPRYNVLGVELHAINLARTAELLLAQPAAMHRRCVTLCDADSLRCARRLPKHRAILNRAWINAPDSGPLAWLGRLAGYRRTGRVNGRDLLDAVCHATRDGSRTHFFYGGEPGTATALADRLLARHPGLIVAGTHSPLPLESDVGALPLNAIRLAQPDFLWIGLPSPEQEAFMHRLSKTDTDFGIAIGVRGAFEQLPARARQTEAAAADDPLEGLWPAQEPGA